MKGAQASALVAVVAMGCAAASGLGVPYRVAHLGQGRPQYADEVGFLGEAGGRAIVLKWGFRDDADEREHLQVELWAGEPASGEAEPLAGFVLPDGFPQPELLGAVHGRLLFQLDHYSPVWTTDGTRAGTTLLSPSFEAVPRTNPRIVHVRIGDRMLLADGDGRAWSTDGTAPGTEPLGIRYPGGWAGDGPPPTLGGRSYFMVGTRLVASDGTAAGTSTVVDLREGDLDGLVATADRLYFVRGTSRVQELWTSDGSPGGTRRVRRFGRRSWERKIDFPMSLGHGVVFLECPDAGSRCHLAAEGVTGPYRASRLTPDRLVPESVALHTGASGLLFADGDGRLWRTDGTVGGTASLGRCAGGCLDSARPLPIGRSGSRSLFYAPTADGEWQVWVTDGTDAGTRPLDADCARRPDCDTGVAAVNGDVALLERSEGTQRELARLDVPSVRPIPELGPGPAMASGDGFLVAGEDLLARLAADGSVPASMALPGRRDADAEPRSLIALGQRLVFTACDGQRQRVYWTEGTPDAVAALADGASTCDSLGEPLPPLSLSGAVVVDAGYGMVRVDAAGNAVTLLDTRPAAMVPVGEALTLLVPSFECAEDSDDCLSGTWLTRVFVSPDAVTPASEVATLRIAPSRDPLALGDRLLVSDPATAEGLFAFRPSAAGEGLEAVRCPAGGEVCSPGGLARLGDVAFLLANGLWRIDGNAATRLAPPAGPPDLFAHSEVVAFGGALWFVGQPAGAGRAWLYRSDSTAGTVALAPFANPYGQLDFRPLGLDGKLYFTAFTPELGEELWVSDGTPAGTHPFLDLREGAEGSRPLLLSVAAGRLFFAADDGEHGVELWSTDGVAAHTAMVADIAPGPLSAWPGRPVLAGGILYFAADDGIAGSELWAVPVAP
jgi:ELWxxDGT repeat protein